MTSCPSPLVPPLTERLTYKPTWSDLGPRPAASELLVWYLDTEIHRWLGLGIEAQRVALWPCPGCAAKMPAPDNSSRDLIEPVFRGGRGGGMSNCGERAKAELSTQPLRQDSRALTLHVPTLSWRGHGREKPCGGKPQLSRRRWSEMPVGMPLRYLHLRL